MGDVDPMEQGRDVVAVAQGRLHQGARNAGAQPDEQVCVGVGGGDEPGFGLRLAGMRGRAAAGGWTCTERASRASSS